MSKKRYQKKQSAANLLAEIKNPEKGRPRNPRDIASPLLLMTRPSMEFWRLGWLFKAIYDLTWRELTKDSAKIFPQTLREDHISHPGYVLEEKANHSVILCPLSTRGPRSNRFVPSGPLDVTNFQWGKRSYLVEEAVSELPRDDDIFDKLPEFLGALAPDKLGNGES